MPFSMPWVIEASQNPPFRPEAPYPTTSDSRSTIFRPGFVSLAIKAVHNPVNPPPITTKSAVSSWTKEGLSSEA